MNIICIDDHPVALDMLLKNVKRSIPDADVHGFVKPEDAMHYAKTYGCEVLLCEIDMYNGNGIVLAEAIQKMYPLVNIIFVTVCSEREYAKEVLSLKPSGYLTKPVNPKQIADELANLRYPVPAKLAT